MVTLRKSENAMIPFYSASDIRSHLPMAECMDAMAEALGALSRGDTMQPLRSVLHLPDRAGALYVMPAYTGKPRALAVKVIGIFPGNRAKGIATHRGVVLCIDPDDGGVRAILDAGALTALRTAAVSALATRLLAREDAAELAILGSGAQATPHLEAMHLVRPIRKVRVFSPTRAHLERFVAEMSEAHHIPVSAATTAREAVEGADIVCTVTSSPQPVLKSEWLKSGVHINAVGASTPATREIDTATVRRARVFVDQRAATLAEAGDILLPMREGAIGASAILGELGELVLGAVKGRTGPEDLTLFKSLGLAVEDAAAADRVVRNAAG
jgi:ornithine cyclodeaminase